ncbi:MAG TPA: hypothetical protein PKL81_14160 [Ferruginibacter sp.]|nr:hypothetical protein [Ferruginibacter sp.]
MKIFLACMLPVALALPATTPTTFHAVNEPVHPDGVSGKNKTLVLNFQEKDEPGRMRSVVFKNQEFCRAEMPKDFEFDVTFKVVSATVYFFGANFTGVEKGTISSNSLKPIKHLMDRCMPGTRVIFDEVRVIGPDKKVRSIAGMNLLLY